MLLRRIFFRESRYPGNLVKSMFKFRLLEGPQGIPSLPQRPKAFRDPAGPYLLGKIGGQLRALGHLVDEPMGYGTCDAICNIVRGNFEFEIRLSLWREEGYLNCILNTFPRPVPWYRKRPALNVPAWAAVCDDVAQVLERLFERFPHGAFPPLG